MSKETTYESAIRDIQKIIEEIESGELGIDTLTWKVKEASDLIKWCKSKLKSTEEELDDLVENNTDRP